MDEIKSVVKTAVKELFNIDLEPQLSRPDEQFGDYATNVALQLAAALNKNPKDIAKRLVAKIRKNSILKIDIAGPGFINITVDDKFLAKQAFEHKNTQPLRGKKVVVEYSDPNPFKILHVGHVYTTIVGDAIAHLYEAEGATVHRVNYGGDVGLHVGKTMWAILRELGGEHPQKLNDIVKAKRSTWLSTCYVRGNTAYETDEKAKAEIIALNKRVYQLHAENDRSSALAQIYWTARDWSYESFDAFYARLGAKVEKYYPESEVMNMGLEVVKKQTGKLFMKSDGAVIFRGEDHGLHTRVFITHEGLPTYETKEIGLIIEKYNDYHFDRSVVITGNEQQEYMQVVLKAIELLLPKLAGSSTYIPHGMVKLKGGIKMSSRLGNIIPADEILDMTAAAYEKAYKSVDDQAVLAAVKYAFLKHRVGGDIIYDPEESVSLEGNSGPYIQYAHARARSILAKAHINAEQKIDNFELKERSLARKIGEYPEVVQKAVQELMPHYISSYLYELAQTFNRFYEDNRVIGDKREAVRLKLVKSYADLLKKGLSLLNISAPEKM